MTVEIESVADARMEVRRALGLPPDTRTLEKEELVMLYEELDGDELEYPDDRYDPQYVSAEDLSLMIAEVLGIPRAKGTNYLRKAELMAALGRLD